MEVLLWHGADDLFSPAAHTRWLGQRIDGATVWIEPHLSHFHALRRTPQLLSWAACAT